MALENKFNPSVVYIPLTDSKAKLAAVKVEVGSDVSPEQALHIRETQSNVLINKVYFRIMFPPYCKTIKILYTKKEKKGEKFLNF